MFYMHCTNLFVEWSTILFHKVEFFSKVGSSNLFWENNNWYCLPGPSRRFRRVCEHLQNLMLGPRGDALNQRKISTDSTSSYTSETGESPRHSSSVRENGEEEVSFNDLSDWCLLSSISQYCYIPIPHPLTSFRLRPWEVHSTKNITEKCLRSKATLVKLSIKTLLVQILRNNKQGDSLKG